MFFFLKEIIRMVGFHWFLIDSFCFYLATLQYKTPLEKFHCLKKTVTIVTDRKMKTPDGLCLLLSLPYCFFFS